MAHCRWAPTGRPSSEAGHVQRFRSGCAGIRSCQAAPPAARLETLSHVFLSCPVAMRAWWWLRGVWARLVPRAAPMPLNKRLLVGGESVWDPGGGPHGLWLHLRLLMLHSLWVVRCSHGGTPQHTAQQVVSTFVQALRRQVDLDWRRAQADVRWGAGMPFAWFRGRNPTISVDKFRAWWCCKGVIATVQQRQAQGQQQQPQAAGGGGSSKSMASTCSGCRLTACELRAGGWSSVTCLSVSALSAHLGLRLCPSVCSSDGMFCGTSALGAGDVTGIPVASTCTPACLPACLICLHVHLSAGQHPCLHVPRSAGSPACLHACSMLRTLVPAVHVPCLGCIFRYFDVLPLGRAACYLV